MALKLLNRVAEFLEQNPEQKFSARAIASWILENYPDECRQKQERSTARLVPLDNDKALITQIVSEIGSGRHNYRETDQKSKRLKTALESTTSLKRQTVPRLTMPRTIQLA